MYQSTGGRHNNYEGGNYIATNTNCMKAKVFG